MLLSLYILILVHKLNHTLVEYSHIILCPAKPINNFCNNKYYNHCYIPAFTILYLPLLIL